MMRTQEPEVLARSPTLFLRSNLNLILYTERGSRCAHVRPLASFRSYSTYEHARSDHTRLPRMDRTEIFPLGIGGNSWHRQSVPGGYSQMVSGRLWKCGSPVTTLASCSLAAPRTRPSKRLGVRSLLFRAVSTSSR